MQKGHLELDLGGHLVHLGSKVNVKWKGSWYEGTVTKIGPRRQLCRVRDVISNQTLLLERGEMKLMESQVLQNNFPPGTRVAYNDGDQWAEGVVETNNSIGAALVSWRQNVHAIENETWFEIADLAPVIHNEAYLAHNEDYLQASKSGLLENDMIEPHPRKVDNILYQSDDESDSPMQAFSRASARKDDHFYHVLDDTQPPQHRIPLGSHTYETIPTPDTTDPRHHLHSTARRLPSKHNPHPSTSHNKHSMNRPLPPPPPHIYPPHTLTHPHTHIPPPIMGPWDVYRSHPYYPILQPPHNHLSPLKLPPGKSLEKSSLPCAWSYTAHYSNGIPPHSTSTFFRQLWGKFSAPVRNRSRVVPRKLSSPPRQFGDLKKSPSNISAAVSEPVPRHGLPVQLVIPHREVSPQHKSSKKIKEQSPKKEKIMKEKSIKPKSKIESPLPYEVPVKKREEFEESVSEEDKREKEELTNHSKKNIQKTGKKKKSPKRKTKETAKDRSGASTLTIASFSPPNVTVNAGGSTMLTCLSAATDGVTYEWYKGKEKLPSKAHPNKVITAPGILEISKNTLKDEGLYSCTVSNDWGTSTRTFNLTVVRAAPPTSSPTHSAQQATAPSGGPSLQSSFNNPVTYAELNLPPTSNGRYDPQTVQQFLDSLVEEIHISDDEFNVDYSFIDDENKEQLDLPERPQAEETLLPENTTREREQEEVDSPIPQIVISSEAPKSNRMKRRRISNAIKNDNDDYLEGYGQNYGALSSATDLDMEGLVPFPSKEIAKSLKRRDKQKTPKAKRKFNIFSRKKKGDNRQGNRNSAGVLEYSEPTETSSPSTKTRDGVSSVGQNEPAHPKAVNRVSTNKKASQKSNVHFAETSQPQHDSTHLIDADIDSVGVNTSLGSEYSVTSLLGGLERGSGEGDEQLQLPTEEESISDQVLRLQRSVEEHQQDEFGYDDKPLRKKKNVLGIFSKRTKT